MTDQEHYKSYFDDYAKSVFQIENDLKFWTHFLTMSIDKYKIENPENRWISQSGFSLFNRDINGDNDWLYISKIKSTIEIDDLKSHSNNFFTWVMNLSLIRMDSYLELLLLQSIQHKYFPLLENPNNGKKQTTRIITEITSYLKINNQNFSTKNNRHLILFIKLKSVEAKTFFENKMNINWQTNWEAFYEFLSTLRNIITHHGMLVSQNKRNEIKSIAGDIFIHYFDQPLDKESSQILKPRNEHLFVNFLSEINDFASNTVKFIAEEENLNFLGFYKA